MQSDEYLLEESWNGSGNMDQSQQETLSSFPHAQALYVAIDADASYKIGTCEHCVLLEDGRPERAWDAQGDKDLDFERNQYFTLLRQLGILMTDRQAYICP